jgi:cold shock CspA family protein
VRGTVTAFDSAAGLGEITDDGGHVVPFHCIVIADGTRQIAVGTDVEFDLIPKLGRYEASNIASR